MELHPLRHSKALESAGYDAAARTLRVRFRSGGLYDYFDVPSHVYERLIASEHPWTEWRAHITTAYDYRRVHDEAE